MIKKHNHRAEFGFATDTTTSTNVLDETAPMDETTDMSMMTGFDERDEGDDEDRARQLDIESDYENKQKNFAKALLHQDKNQTWSNFFFLVCFSAIPGALYIAAFTQIGYGLKTYYYLSENINEHSSLLLACIVLVVFLLYLLDIDSWKSTAGIFYRHILTAVVMIASAALCLCLSKDHPEAPILAFSIINPFWLILVKHVFFGHYSYHDFLSLATKPLFATTVLPIVAFVVWIKYEGGNTFTEVTQTLNAVEVGCVPDFTINDNQLAYCEKANGEVCFTIDNNQLDFSDNGCDANCLDVFADCSNTFIVWIGPLLVSVSLLFLGLFATLMQSSMASKELANFAKVWALLLAVVWVTLSLNGMSNDIFQAALYFTLWSFVGSVTLLAATHTRDELKDDYKELLRKLTEKFGAYFDVVRGLLLVTFLPLGIIFVAVSCLNQAIRYTGCLPCSKKLVENDELHHGWFTKSVTKLYYTMKKWDRVRIVVYAIYWGIAYMIMNVVAAQFVVLLLGWLINEVQGYSLVGVTAILVFVGMILFLLPPVPGVPIYLTLGIVIPAVARSQFGLVLSVAYCVGVSVVLKLVACATQQKLIGEQLSDYTSIRKMVGINSSFVRAMRVVLSDKGFTIAKVTVLVGGPDWPTSVLCGILKLNLLQILLGTTPVVFLILPTVLTGTFTYMAALKEDDGNYTYSWASTASAIFFALTSVVQFGSMVLAGVYLERVSTIRKEEIENVPIDQEVKALEDAEEEYNKIYKDVTQWDVVPGWVKAVLLLSLVTMVIPCYITTLFLSSSFANFELTSTIDEDLDGNWLNFILDLGWLSLGLFFFSLILLNIFFCWAKHASNRRASEVSA